MDRSPKRLAILGGDRRQEILYELFQLDGYDVSRVPRYEKELIVGPVPCSRDGQYLFDSRGEMRLTFAELFENMRAYHNTLFVAGAIPKEIQTKALSQDIHTVDLMELEEVAVANAVPTAEGAIQAAMQNSEVTLFGKECLVLGFGRCGKILAHMLKGIGMQVAVEARSGTDEAYIKGYGYDFVSLLHLDKALYEKKYAFLFNTIPAPILNRERLGLLRKDCLIIDIASTPGGTDFPAAEQLGLQALLLPGLPGKVAPVTAAQILKEAIEKRFF